MIGTPIYDRLWNDVNELREPFPRLIQWYVKHRPMAHDPVAVSTFIVSIASVLTLVEHAITEFPEE